MTHSSKLGPWVRRFLLEHLISKRNLSANTQRSYRDVLALLIPFVAAQIRKRVDDLALTDISEAAVVQFLSHLESDRRCSGSTRNQRLAAIHAFCDFVGRASPEHISWCGEIRAIPFKKCAKNQITYLEKSEMDALLAAPDLTSSQGLRDYVVLLFLYNTGARANEVAQLTVSDLSLARGQTKEISSVRIWGKGKKERICPLWPQTAKELLPSTQERGPTEHVFLNRCGRPITRFGIHDLVERYAKKVAVRMPSLTQKRVSPHTIRHTTATHLLRAGVDLNTIRAWLGHVRIDTTNIYAEIDLEMKARALAHCDLGSGSKRPRWTEDKGIMAFLREL